MKLSNALSLLRIVLTFVVMGLLFLPGLPVKLICLALFLVASLTDWLDGYLARRLHQVTPLGALLDPIADKVLVLGLLLAFVQLRLIPAWMLLVVLIRELLITGVRFYALGRHIVIPAAKEGKHKTVSQILTIFLILVLLVVQEADLTERAASQVQVWLEPVILISMSVTVALTIYSGATFFWRNRSVFLDGSGGASS